MSILVFGHKNPDTDTICSAIAYAELKNKLGKDVKPVRLGEINEETKYVLDYFKVEKPELVENVAGKEIILVDHNERTQTADGFEEAKVLELIDHHRISNFNVDEPLMVRMAPVGCTATIILGMYKENELVPSKEVAGLMLSAIISDTLLFKSPTCTQQDIEAATELARIAEIDVNSYGLEMLKAGTNLSTKSEAELIDLDAKSFPMGSYNMRIAQVNVVDEQELLARREALEFSMKEANATHGYDTFLLVVTNILTSVSTGLVVGEALDTVAKAFNTDYENGLLILPGVVSRKKQVVPPLTVAFEN